jgi:uncharacterized protein
MREDALSSDRGDVPAAAAAPGAVGPPDGTGATAGFASGVATRGEATTEGDGEDDDCGAGVVEEAVTGAGAAPVARAVPGVVRWHPARRIAAQSAVVRQSRFATPPCTIEPADWSNLAEDAVFTGTVPGRYRGAAMGEKERILAHLENDYTEPIRDPVWRHIYLSPGLLRVAEHAQFQKLDRIRQLGPATIVYPGATHTRRNHSLGVFHIARRMITTLVRRNRDVPMTLEGVKAFLCAALLHDIGHYPYAHSLKDLALDAHEALAARAITTDFALLIRGGLGIEPEAVAAIIDKGWRYDGGENVAFYWKILSSVIDPDKLDYLNRDAFFCGVPYGIQDVDFILEEIWPHAEKGVAISRKGVTALETILFSKYLMYKTVYWHKTVRIATAMIKKVIAAALADGTIRKEELYGLDDAEFSSRFTAARHPSFSLIEDTRRRVLHKQVIRVPFDEASAGHRLLEDIGRRLALEQVIAREAGRVLGRPVPAESIVVDVPERISFELHLPVIDPSLEEPADMEAGSESFVFGRLGHDEFPRSLRAVSVSARRDEDLLAALGRMDLAGYLAG